MSNRRYVLQSEKGERSFEISDVVSDKEVYAKASTEALKLKREGVEKIVVKLIITVQGIEHVNRIWWF